MDAYTGRRFEGSIKEIRLSPQNVQNVVTYNVVLNVQNPDQKLLPGMTANLTFAVAERKAVLKVPNAALRFSPKDMTPEKIREIMRGLRGGQGGEQQATPSPEGRQGAQAGQGGGGGQDRRGQQGQGQQGQQGQGRKAEKKAQGQRQKPCR